MTTRADNTETLAIRAALQAFSETLNRELEAIGGMPLGHLDGTEHRHVSLLLGAARPIVVIVDVRFTSDAAAVDDALARATGKASACGQACRRLGARRDARHGC